MKVFDIRADLAAGLSYRLEKLDTQIAIDVIGGKSEQAIRTNLRIVKNIEEGNKVFMDEVTRIQSKKMEAFKGFQAKYQALSDEEKAKETSSLSTEYNKQAAEIQKESTAKPDEVVQVLLSDEDYAVTLLLFEKTASYWDEEDKNTREVIPGSGKRIFIEVADSLATGRDAS